MDKKALEILEMDATETAELIKNGYLTSEQVVRTYINHIKTVNPSINAIVEERFNDALVEAKHCDKTFDSNVDKGPLYGVPISVKEAFDVSGMKTTGGLIHRQNQVADQDAHVVKKLKVAGAIILGKTNTPTLCYCQETDNKLYGRTNNPWDLNMSAGGSSGGEAALLAAGGAAIGIGSDIGGSIRFPSHFNGIIGFKSGNAQINSQGHFPADTIPLQTRMASIGPMGKSVRDMALMYDIIANNKPPKLKSTNIMIDILPSKIDYPLSERTNEFLNEVEVFLNKTFKVKRALPPHFEKSAQLWQEIMSIDGGKKMKSLAFNTDHPTLIRSYIKEKLTKKTDVHAYLSWALIGANLFKPSKIRIKEIEAIIEANDKELSLYLSDRLIILPVYHTATKPHGDVYAEIFSIRKTFLKYMPYVAYANVFGLPSLTIPIGVDDDNLPLAIQIISKNGNEDLIFKVGELIAKEFRGYQRCTDLD